jgi:hypothetical protein
MNSFENARPGKAKAFALPPLDHSTLEGYTEDRETLRRFERRFFLPAALGALLFLAPFVYLFIYKKPLSLIGLCAVGFLTLLGTIIAMYRATPISSTGQPMEKYGNTSPSARGDEVLYVCHDSKTFFRRTFAKRSHSR